MSRADVRLDVYSLRNLIDEYWSIAYAEGMDGRTQDTEDGRAQKCRHEIEVLLKRLAKLEKTA